jgi:hypothetical protein
MTTEKKVARKKKPKRIGETMIGFDLKNREDHADIQDIQHAVGRTSRTASEAFRDADYATPIWKCSTDFDRSIHFIKDALVGFCGVGAVIGGVIFLIMWITK